MASGFIQVSRSVVGVAAVLSAVACSQQLASSSPASGLADPFALTPTGGIYSGSSQLAGVSLPNLFNGTALPRATSGSCGGTERGVHAEIMLTDNGGIFGVRLTSMHNVGTELVYIDDGAKVTLSGVCGELPNVEQLFSDAGNLCLRDGGIPASVTGHGGMSAAPDTNLRRPAFRGLVDRMCKAISKALGTGQIPQGVS